ncbi:MAG: NAD-dependent protein deacylase [Firmicutes bacterium]|nr:NAD-dependent protein deacylase [Bacillota bacterium]
MDTEIQKLGDLINAARRVVFFGGAGVSTESGIPDFRSADGLYSQKFAYPPEYMLSRTFFDEHTEEFYAFYRAKMLPPQSVKPNAAHMYLANLEKRGLLTAVITQNIDGLHQAAGSKTVLELHGSVWRNFCMGCGKFFETDIIVGAWRASPGQNAEGNSALPNPKGVPLCDVCGKIIKPDVVLYEEGLNNETLEKAVAHIARADVLIIGGTSLNVYPAAGLVRYCNGKTVIINKSPTPYDSNADLLIADSIGKVFGALASMAP